MLSYFENAIHNWKPSLQKDVHQCYTMHSYSFNIFIVLPCTLSPFFMLCLCLMGLWPSGYY